MPRSRKTRFIPLKLSLKELLGADYTNAVCAARAFLSGEDARALRAVAARKVDFYPRVLQERLATLLQSVGQVCSPGLPTSARGATSKEFESHTALALAPLSGFGFLRLGEGGRLFLTSKSEHYHVPLGHGFPGYGLIDHARTLGIPNATHNNTRGHIARTLERELVRTAAGLAGGDDAGLDKVLASRRSTDLNRVINLETGSLAAEAAVKMIMARFYQSQPGTPEPKYSGRTPVFVVMGDDEGGHEANYHGTTVLTQTMRGMWPEFVAALEKHGVMMVRSVRPDNTRELEEVFREYDRPPFKIAGLFHELVLMNYAAKRLSLAFVKRMYALCRKHDVPTVCDEIQTGIWSPLMYMFREYGVNPSFVVIGKGFPGGEYAASRILFGADMDTLPQFGALVTNGQEELASLAYLITMRWAETNAEVTCEVGEYYEERLKCLADEFPGIISAIEGRRHLAGVYFAEVAPARRFAERMNSHGFDISVQTYKAGCPPSALTKLPLTAGYEVVDLLVARMADALGGL